MTTVKMTPSTLSLGAVSCRRVAIDAAAVARQIKAHQPPPQVPPEAMSAVHDAMNQLQRSAIATERQALFLETCAHRGLLADGPFGLLASMGLPPLLSPWPMPAAPKKHNGILDQIKRTLDGDLETFKGFGEELLGTVEAAADVGLALTGVAIDLGSDGHPSDRIPFVGDKRRQLARGVDWAVHHPKKFVAAFGEDLIDYKDWSHGRVDRAIGHNAAALLELGLIGGKVVGAAGDVSRAGRVEGGLGKEAAKAGAEARKATSGLHEGASAAAHGVAERDARMLNLKAAITRSQAQVAAHRTELAREHRAEVIKEAGKEVPKTVAKGIGEGVAKILTGPDAGAEPEPAK